MLNQYIFLHISLCRRLKRIEEPQEMLNQHKAMLNVLPHLSKTGDNIVREVLAFLAAMLFGGNEIVQVSVNEIPQEKENPTKKIYWLLSFCTAWYMFYVFMVVFESKCFNGCSTIEWKKRCSKPDGE